MQSELLEVHLLRTWHLMQDRHFAMLLGRCLEEAAVLRLNPQSSAQGDFSVSGGVTGRSLSCKVSDRMMDESPNETTPFNLRLLPT